MLAKGSRLKDFYCVKTYDNSISDILGALFLVILQAYMALLYFYIHQFQWFEMCQIIF